MTGRRVVVVVVANGSVAGQLPSVELPRPYWQETSDLAAVIASTFGLDVQVLRLLASSRPEAPGGDLTVLAELTGGEAAGAIGQIAQPYHGLDPLAEHPLRMPYASPGGPGATLTWSRRVVADLGRGHIVDITQHRTWNLSAIWEIVMTTGRVWVKQVPLRLFSHEPTVLRLLADAIPGQSPSLLAEGAEGRMLLDRLPGVDGYGRGFDDARALAELWHSVQVAMIGRADELVAAGVPDARWPALISAVRHVAAPFVEQIDGLASLIEGLGDRIASIEEAGLPETLVHGDLHLGNARFDTGIAASVRSAGDTRAAAGRAGELVAAGGAPIVLDLGDSCIGHPAFDILRLAGELGEAEARALEGDWVSMWAAAVPGARPEHALRAIRPIAALRHAVTFANFLANIEPSEHPYHATDVPFWLTEAVHLSTVGI